MSSRAVIVDAYPADYDYLGRRYGAAIVSGTIHSYHPSRATIFRWTARGAKRAGDRAIRRIERAEARIAARQQKARIATGYGQEKR